MTEHAGAASSTTPTNGRLRTAIATDGDLRYWQARCVEELAAVPGVAVVRWIRLPGHRAGRRPRADSGALASVPVPDALRTVEPEARVSAATADASSPTVDVLLDLTERGLPTPLPWAPEVWRFGYGRDLKRDPSWVALHDYVRGPGVTKAALVSQPSGSIVREGWLRTLSWWKGSSLESLLLDTVGWPAAAAFERMEAATGPHHAGAPPHRSNPRVPSPPRSLLTVAAIGRRALGATDSLAGRDHWNVGYIELPISTLLDPKRELEIRWLPVRPEHYAADPFGLERDGAVHVFFEDFDQRTGVGSICHVAIERDGRVSAPESVLNPGVHASYPYLVERDGHVFMLPETAAAGELVLYEARDFPYDWRPAATLLAGMPILDASVIEYAGRWWMFATRRDRGGNQNLLIWHAPDLFGPWTPHAGNPVKTDARSSRPGGTPFVSEGHLYRPSQDDSLVYGGRLVLNRVDVLTPGAFAERQVAVVEPPRESSYPDGLHTLSAAGPYTLLDGNLRQRTLKRFARSLAGRLAGRRSGR